MRGAVIGAGVIGVSTAYFLAQNGHQVSVIEQHGNVSEEASFGHAGLLGGAHLAPIAGPFMIKRVLSQWFSNHQALRLKPRLNLTQWSWFRAWLRECNPQQFSANKEKLHRLGRYSQVLLEQLKQLHQIDFQECNGVLQICRQNTDLQKMNAGLDVLTQADNPFQQLDASATHLLEPALNPTINIAGSIYMPQDGQGNCVLFTKQLKLITQKMGVDYAFLTACLGIEESQNGVTLQLQHQKVITPQHFDAVVIATGGNSLPFIKASGIDVPIVPFNSYSITANIKNPEDCPQLNIIDETLQIALVKMDKRLRIAGCIRLGQSSTSQDKLAWQLLRNVGSDWFANAANYNTAQTWRTSYLMQSNGLPLIGQSPKSRIFVNTAHAENGWSLAAGAAKIVADVVSNKSSDIDLNGLALTH